MKAIRYFSHMNEFLDFVVIVPEGFCDKAIQIVKDAVDKFWDDQYEAYGDAVENELAAADVPFEVHYMPWDDEGNCPVDEDAWENWIEELNDECPVTTVNC